MKSFDIKTDVTLECPSCRTYKTVPRSADLPPNVRLVEVICPDCDDGDFHSETWFSAPGVEVSQDREAYIDEIWQELVEKDDRTSPAEYPEMALITYGEVIQICKRAEQQERERPSRGH